MPGNLAPELETLLASARRVARTAPFPTPPQQGRPWDLPATTPPEVAEWIRLLHGPLDLPDPRGCPLHWVVLTVGTDTGPDVMELVTTAYLLPRTSDAAPPFVIAWNGLMYQAAAVGAELSLEEALARTSFDVARTLIERDDALLSELQLIRDGSAREAYGVTTPTLGMAGLAQPSTSPTDGDRCATGALPRATCIRLLAAAVLGRAIGAQARGDDALALASVRQAVALREAALQLGTAAIEDEDRILVGWETMDELLVDLERRAADPPDADERTRALAAPSDHLDWLIAELDEITVVQRTWPGGGGLWDDPIAEAALAAGPALIPRLLEATSDDRLTRGVTFFRPFAHGRSLVHVSQVAWSLVRDAIDRHLPWTRLESCEDLSGPAAVDCALDALSRTPHTPLEGWLAVLADDSAQERWAEAARRLARAPLLACRRTPVIDRLSTRSLDAWRSCSAPLASLDASRQDALRVQLLRRLGQLLANELRPRPGSASVCNVALALVSLPGEGVVEGLRSMSQTCGGPRGPCDCEVELIVARVMHGDESALPEWAIRLRALERPRVGGSYPWFAPGWLWPEREDVQAAIREVLARRPLAAVAEGIAGPVLGSPALREWVLRALESDEIVGAWSLHATGGLSFGEESWERSGDCSGAVLSTTPMRLGELVAARLGHPPSLPPFAFDPDPEARRASVAVLSQAIHALPWGPTAGPSPLRENEHDCW